MSIFEAWFTWFVCVTGTVYLVTESAIFAIVRALVKRVGSWTMILVYCRACFGFWTGLIFAERFPIGAGRTKFYLSALTAMMIGYVWSKLWDNDMFAAENPELVAHDDGV